MMNNETLTVEEFQLAADTAAEWIDQLAEKNDKTINDTIAECHQGMHGDAGKAAAEVLYAWQYDGIIGDCVTRWNAAAK